MPEGKKEIKVEFQKDIIGGVYANTLYIQHTPEEFVMDFLMVAPPSGAVTARVITSPGHMKRIISALQENMKKYEAKFGVIKPAIEPEHCTQIGFKP
ncbi:hypothetical protein ES703_27869 [subsurface metagenome]